MITKAQQDYPQQEWLLAEAKDFTSETKI